MLDPLLLLEEGAVEAVAGADTAVVALGGKGDAVGTIPPAAHLNGRPRQQEALLKAQGAAQLAGEAPGALLHQHLNGRPQLLGYHSGPIIRPGLGPLNRSPLGQLAAPAY